MIKKNPKNVFEGGQPGDECTDDFVDGLNQGSAWATDQMADAYLAHQIAEAFKSKHKESSPELTREARLRTIEDTAKAFRTAYAIWSSIAPGTRTPAEYVKLKVGKIRWPWTTKRAVTPRALRKWLKEGGW